MYYNWTVMDIPDCWENFFYPGLNNGDQTKCYLFTTNNEFRMAPGLSPDHRNGLRRLDFYWNIDNISNISYATITVPAIAVQLYDHRFSTWAPETIGDTAVEKEKLASIQLGSSRATSFLNHSSSIFYYVEKYRAIKHRDAASILGLKRNYVDIFTLVNFQHNWPLQANLSSTFDRDLYHGVFSVQLARSTIEIKTEIRQHTVLAAIALAGGCYGVFTTIYILLFGMTRLTPWGLVHHIPALISNKNQQHMDTTDEESNIDKSNQDTQQASHVKKNKRTITIPWFFRRHINENKTFTFHKHGDAFIKKMMIQQRGTEERHSLDNLKKDGSKYSPEISLLHAKKDSDILSDASSRSDKIEECRPSKFNKVTSSVSTSFNTNQDPAEIINQLYIQKDKSSRLEAISNELSNRVEELEIILKEYFINTTYLDQIRRRTSILPVNNEENNNSS
ncbi:uncharacterized protein BX663DRAFT_496491 [Cokeromyces recurvatus]|uniref:uncharacterized protein n=1 Tax=Cokeromyces recurvatus TaxID=90255 RepID=UPI00221F39D9|nr:uncharacterized protein BX663DRAFT_496491 [Cokeromyces recurvatus]KAI7906459.1 hypothetical protein BX663DRAFT_496491 [Cokeromyces recurvatus]